MLTNQPQVFLKGLDRSAAPLVADKMSLYVLRNLRQRFEQRGVLEQTPSFYNFETFSQGTYYNAGSQTEPSTSGIRLITADIIVTDYVIRTVSGQAQVLYQTTVPATETIYTGCRLVVGSITGLGITLGSTLDVEMTGAAAFRWRKNGGGWTAGIPSVSGVSIDGGNATLYFLAATGFAGTEAWAWTRLDRSWADTGTLEYPCEFMYYKGELYFTSVDDRLMVCASSSTGKYVISVGYRPVVSSYFTFFDDHLVCTWFRKGTTGWTGADRWYIVGWSDKTDVHNFIPTDTNEADQYALPNTNKFDSVGNSAPDSYIMGITVEQNQVFVFTNNELYSSSALGLPLVFSYGKQLNFRLTSAFSPVIKADLGTYIIAYNEVYFFDGGSFKTIGGAVVQGTDNNNFDNSFGCWDPVRKELHIVLGILLLSYQEKWDTWYSRKTDFDVQTQPVKSISSYTGDIVVGIKSLKLRRENTAYNVQPIFDSDSGTVYAEPYLVTQIYGDNLAVVKELAQMYVGASVNSTGISTTFYTTGTGVTFQVSYWLTPAGDFENVSEVIPSGATYTTANADGFVDIGMRVPFRGIALAVEVQGTAAKPPAGATIAQLVPLVYNASEKRVEK